jgi:hypothetical protein
MSPGYKFVSQLAFQLRPEIYNLVPIRLKKIFYVRGDSSP